MKKKTWTLTSKFQKTWTMKKLNGGVKNLKGGVK